jgi:regulator of cell morphogenesis and NO signaling
MPTSTQCLREIVANQASAAAILQRFDFDLCAQAEVPLDRACAEMQLSVDQVLEKLADAKTSEPGAQTPNPASLSTPRLIQHIVRVHHRRVRQELPGFSAMAQELAGKRGDRAPELKDFEALVTELRDDLVSHIEKEELVLFPFIMQMDEEANYGESAARACSCSVTQPIAMMMKEHDSATRVFSELRRQTRDFEPPEWACATHIALFAGLRAFEIDLSQHVYLENEVLFPRAIELKAQLNRGR